MNKKILIVLLSCVIIICLLLIIFDKLQEKKKNEVKIIYNNVVSKISIADVNVLKDTLKNQDIVGRLYIDKTDIDVPILQYSDNDYYLKHLPDGSYNIWGSVFLDYRNKITDKKLIIYGHSSNRVTTEFNSLYEYLNKDYYNNHSDIYFDTKKGRYHYKIFSVYVASDNYTHVNLNLNDNNYLKHINYIKNSSLYDTSVIVNSSDDIIILQTCHPTIRDAYIIVAGKKIK